MPRVANLVTLVVVVSAIGWSGGQRPSAVAGETAATTPLPVLQAVPVQSPSIARPNQANWPAKTTTLPVDGLQVVGFTPALR